MKKNLFILFIISFLMMIGIYLFLPGKDGETDAIEKMQPTLNKATRDTYMSFSSSSLDNISIIKAPETSSMNEEFESGEEYEKKNPIETAEKFIDIFYEYESVVERNHSLEQILSPTLFQEYKLPEDNTTIVETHAKLMQKSLYISPSSSDNVTIVALVDLTIDNVPQSIFVQISFDSDENLSLINNLVFKTFLSEYQ